MNRPYFSTSGRRRGEEAARSALEIAHRVGPIREGERVENLEEVVALAFRVRRLASQPGKARWDKLIAYLRTMPEKKAS